jgi:hypothetical protein
MSAGSLTCVYGPTEAHEKEDFLAELSNVAASVNSQWLVCGDFSWIYQAAKKNNARLHRGLMRRFRQALDHLQLAELHLSGRLCSSWIELGLASMSVFFAGAVA